MKKKIHFMVFKDERFNFILSFQRTEDKLNKWVTWYIGFLFWTFEFLFVEGMR